MADEELQDLRHQSLDVSISSVLFRVSLLTRYLILRNEHESDWMESDFLLFQ